MNSWAITCITTWQVELRDVQSQYMAEKMYITEWHVGHQLCGINFLRKIHSSN